MDALRMSAFRGKADMTVCTGKCPLVAQADISRVPASAWCPKGQFISGRVDVKIGGIGEHGG